MSIKLYDVSIPVLIRGLTNLAAIIEKAAEHAAAKKIDPVVLAQARLYPGHVSARPPGPDHVRYRQGSRCAPGRHRDPEARGQRSEPRRSQAAGREDPGLLEEREGRANEGRREQSAIEIKLPNRTINFTGLTYLNNFVLPNFFFHESMTYALLRS